MSGARDEVASVKDAEVRDLIAWTLVRESAQAAGLEVALPYGEGLGGRLLVFGAGEEPCEPVRGRWVHVGYCGYGDSADSPPPTLKPGELLALHDVADARPEAVFLLTAGDRKRMPGNAAVMREEWRATRERWRACVLGG